MKEKIATGTAITQGQINRAFRPTFRQVATGIRLVATGIAFFAFFNYLLTMEVRAQDKPKKGAKQEQRAPDSALLLQFRQEFISNWKGAPATLEFLCKTALPDTVPVHIKDRDGNLILVLLQPAVDDLKEKGSVSPMMSGKWVRLHNGELYVFKRILE